MFSLVNTKCEKTVNLKSVNVRRTVKSKSVKQFPDQKDKVPPGFEPRSQESEPWVITNYTMGPRQFDDAKAKKSEYNRIADNGVISYKMKNSKIQTTDMKNVTQLNTTRHDTTRHDKFWYFYNIQSAPTPSMALIEWNFSEHVTTILIPNFFIGTKPYNRKSKHSTSQHCTE